MFKEDLKPLITAWDERAREVYGYDVKEVIGQPSSILVPADRGDESDYIVACLKGGYPITDYATVRLTKCGKRINVRITILPIRDSGGRLIGGSTITKTIPDDTHLGEAAWADSRVADSTKSETALCNCDCATHVGTESNDCACAQRFRKRNAEFRTIFEYAAVGMALVGADGRCIRLNPAGEQLFGYTEQEMRQLRFREYTHPDDREMSERDFAGLMDGTCDSYTHEKRYIRKDGQVVFARVTASIVRTVDPSAPGRHTEPRYCVVMVEDISARKRAEIELHESHQRQGLFVEQNPLGVIGWDPHLRITEWNPAAEQIFGYPRGEALQHELSLLLPDSTDACATTVFGEVLAKKIAKRGVMQNRTRDGRTIECEWYASALLDSNGSLVGMLALCEDVTGQRKLEEQLRQAQKMEAIGRLAGGVAHDFNNLLNVILGYTHMLQQECATERAREHATEILRASEGATALTRQLLAFSRKQVLQPRIVDLNVTASATSKMLRRVIGEDIDLVLELADKPAFVMVDAGQMDQVIMNLAINARDAMAKGGQLKIATSTSELDQEAAAHFGLVPGTYAVLTVSDTGVGMTSDTLSHLFEPFFTTKAPGKGTGLGLATVHGIIQQSGGSIQVKSQLGLGSVFAIYLPTTEAANMTLVPGNTKPASVVTGCETILLVEDDASLRKLTFEVLRSGGYRVLEAGDGNAAIEIASCHSGPIALVVTDTVMPKMRGSELAPRLREILPGIKVLFVTGYSHADVALDPDTDVLEKPFTPDSLLCKIRDVLAHQNTVARARTR